MRAYFYTVTREDLDGRPLQITLEVNGGSYSALLFTDCEGIIDIDPEELVLVLKVLRTILEERAE